MVEILIKLTPLIIGVSSALLTYMGIARQERAKEKRHETEEAKRLDERRAQDRSDIEQMLNAFKIESQAKDRMQQEALNALIRKELLDTIREVLPNNRIDLHTLEAITYLYTMYKSFGGNHMIDEFMKKVNQLDVVDSGELSGESPREVTKNVKKGD